MVGYDADPTARAPLGRDADPTARAPLGRDADPTARALLGRAGAVTVLTGAGVSTGSGIPDFRGPAGLWTTRPDTRELFDIDVYRRDPQARVRAWQERRDHPVWSARPNAAHTALAGFERSGRLRALVTQNIDGLHQAAGSGVDAPLWELHGTLHRVVCLDCGARAPMSEALARVRDGEADPPCRRCGGVLKSDTISFGQALDADVLAGGVAAARGCDVFVAVGTSLLVHPAAGLCDVAVASGAALVVVNGEPTPYDGVAAAVVRGSIPEVLPALLAVAPR